MILITASGRDRPGMVAAIAQKLFEANCSIQDATMTRLSGEFAMILVVAPSPTISLVALSKSLMPLHSSHGLKINLSPIEPREENDIFENQIARYMLSVYGPDHTGLVAGVSEVLAKQKVNITDLQTRVAGGRGLYIMLFELEIPAEVDLEILRTKLDQITRKLNLDYSLNPVEEDTL